MIFGSTGNPEPSKRILPLLMCTALAALSVILPFVLQSCTDEQVESPEYRHTVSSDNSSPEGAVVTAWDEGKKLAATAISSGKYRLTFISERETVTIDSLTAAKEGFEPFSLTSVSVKGQKTIDINLKPVTKTFWLYGESSTPPGATLTVYDEGKVLDQTTIRQDSTYRTKDLALPADNKTDSVVVSADGYIKKIYENITVSEKGNKLEVALARTTHEYWLYSHNSNPDGAEVKGWKDGQNIYTATIANGNYETNHTTDTATTITIDSLVTTANGYGKDVKTNITLTPGGTQQDIQLTTKQYQHTINITTKSNKENKKIKDGTTAYIITNQKDTTWTTTNNETITHTWTNKDSITNTTIGLKNIPGHENTETNTNVGTTKNITITANAITYQQTINAHTQNQDENPIQYALIKTAGKQGTTNEQGNTSITNITLQTNEYNEYEPYTETITAEPTNQSPNFEKQTKTYTAKPETTNITFNLVTTHEHWLYSNNSKPEGASVKGWKDGIVLLQATINNNSYETNHTTDTEETITIDSLVTTATGYEKDVKTNITLTTGGTQQDINLKKINNYNIDLIITEETGDTLLTGKTINIKEPDGDQQQKTITQQHTNITIQGTYDENDSIKIWLTPDTEYDGLTGTTIQNLGLPLSSVYDNGNRKDTITLRIGDLQGKTTYALFMKKNTHDDYNTIAIAEEGGNTEYRHLDNNGERTQNIIRIDISEQGTPTPTKIRQYYNEAVAMHQAKLTTAQGLQIIKINYDSTNIMPTTQPPGEFYLIVDDTAPTPGNNRGSDLAGTFNRGTTILRSWDDQNNGLANSELGECIIPLKDRNDTGSNGYAYVVDPKTHNVIDIKIKPLRVATTYKKLTIPDPTP